MSRVLNLDRNPKKLVLFRRQNLTALVHAGLQVDVVRTAQLARILVFGVRICAECMVRTTHVAP